MMREAITCQKYGLRKEDMRSKFFISGSLGYHSGVLVTQAGAKMGWQQPAHWLNE
jgi:hypothetical protein